MPNAKMTAKIGAGQGFIAALDQSGGSTPKALRLYGIEESEYDGEAAMFDLIHEMRTRIVTSPAFTGDKVIGAILFEQTMDREVEGKPTSQYLWEEKGVVPFLKIDKGLEAEKDGVQLMKPIPGLADLLARAAKLDVFGTKERSVISAANATGIAAIVEQQFEVGREVIRAGMMPILEPEVTISIPDKAEAEALLRTEILKHLNEMEGADMVMLKLSLPSEPNFYEPLIEHPRVLKVVALSGGYTRDEANELLAKNKGMIASFSRALSEGLSARQSDADFDATLKTAVDGIHAASVAG
ncbi:fructose bisphosphate aldolase [Celeribacter indicus]|uniref:fructose-bisphosphate aldolase n=1 Tax=Celeribacter indicus TaxID=1208324 RepID=A0A0B5E1T1_9RHOB|nr:fructose bisphosphate aldolase [Celeribacter indicus]AJE46422.1 fructose-1,6-bisphosphate aldolase [Celeribacter indicus]SDW56293.1 fructose-bisphosphate aldolase [Celeribacter indicus]